MTKENIIRKLTSRKLWLAVAGFVSGLLVALRVDAETAETVSGLIMAGASVIAYILGEGLIDAANSKADTAASSGYISFDDYKPPEEATTASDMDEDDLK